jgi:hypothetical protein
MLNEHDGAAVRLTFVTCAAVPTQPLRIAAPFTAAWRRPGDLADFTASVSAELRYGVVAEVEADHRRVRLSVETSVTGCLTVNRQSSPWLASRVAR